MNHLEIEYKTLLSKAEFHKIEQELQHIPLVSQTNYYFDTVDFQLKAHRMSLRIRTYQDRAEMTLKTPEKVGNFEYNQALTLEQAKALRTHFNPPAGQIKDLLDKTSVALKDVVLLGHLHTERREIQTKIGLMALDYNVYAGLEDYELELEVTDAKQGKADFETFLKVNGIQFKYAKSKVARFSATLKD